MKKSRDYVWLLINGKRHEMSTSDAFMMLADFLRSRINQTGTKIVCAEGDCGACSVLRLDESGYYRAINSCIISMAQLDGANILTVEALANEEILSVVQSALLLENASQCGFCTPGIAVTLTALAEKEKCKGQSCLNQKQVQNALTGNLCRCTGYQAIIDAGTKVDLHEHMLLKQKFATKKLQKNYKKSDDLPVCIESEAVTLYVPSKLKDALSILRKNKNVQILAAGTDLGVLVNKNKLKYTKILSLNRLSELQLLRKHKNEIQIGALASLTDVRKLLTKSIPEFANFLNLFASPQIKNIATLVGNIANASPIADTPPFLLCMDAELNLVSFSKKHKIPLSEFYLGYKKLNKRSDELIHSISFDVPDKNEIIFLKKASQRKDLDISALNFAGRLRLSKNKEIEFIRIAMGGVGPVSIRFIKTENALLGKKVTAQLLDRVTEVMQKEMNPISDLRGSAAFRRVLAARYLRMFLERKSESTLKHLQPEASI